MKHTENTPGNEKISMQAVIGQSVQLSACLNIDTSILLDKRVCTTEIEQRKNDNPELQHVVQYLDGILDTSILKTPLIITDDEGCVLYIKGSAETEPLLREGVMLGTEQIGTNAFDLALKHLIPVKVTGPEHTLKVLAHSISFGVPILHGSKLLGGIGFVLSIKDNYQSGVMENIIRSCLHAIAKMLEARKNLDELFLLKNFFINLDNDRGIIVTNSDFEIIQVNREAEILLGVPKQYIVDHSFGKIFSGVNPADIDINKGCRLNFCSSAGKSTVAAYQKPVMGEKGRLVGYCVYFDPAEPAEKIIKSGKRRSVRFEFKDIIGENKDFLRLLKLAHAIARSPSSVFITGESGTGKELFAQAVHQASTFNKGPFIAINCAAIPGELMETELFGYVDGAFTGARKGGMDGKLKQANGGTLFLDEIGDMPVRLQPKILRILQERSVVPVGGNRDFPLDFRIISATNQKIEALIAENRFRADLYYRLNVINLRIPPLRERKDDIPRLTNHFIKKYNRTLNKSLISISDAALELLMDYNWPGNIRELENVIETAVNLADDIIEAEHLESYLGRGRNIMHMSEDQSVIPLEESEKNLMIRALNTYQGNITQTANALKIGRSTLYRKIKKYDLFSYVKPQ